MVAIPQLEGGLCETDVDHRPVWASDLGVVDYVGRQAVPLEGAEILIPAVARFSAGSFLVFFQGLLVVSFDDTGNVRHAAVTDLKCIPVEYAMQF